jgi:hypothetical protein
MISSANAAAASYMSTAGQGDVRQWFGIYAGLVVNNNDPINAGRITCYVPQVMGNAVTTWVEPLVPSSSAPPTPGSQVIVQFLGGDPNHPLYLPYAYSASASTVNVPTTFNSSTTFNAPVTLSQIDGPGAMIYFFTANGIVPNQPGTTIPEVWHQVGAAGQPGFYPGSPWAQGSQYSVFPGNAGPLRYRLNITGEVEITGTFNVTASSNSFKQVFTLPSGYYNSSVQQRFTGQYIYNNSPSVETVFIAVDSGGILRVTSDTGASPTIADISVNIVMPLS